MVAKENCSNISSKAFKNGEHKSFLNNNQKYLEKCSNSDGNLKSLIHEPITSKRDSTKMSSKNFNHVSINPTVDGNTNKRTEIISKKSNHDRFISSKKAAAIPIFCGTIAFFMSILSKSGSDFLSFQDPLTFKGSSYIPLKNIGLNKISLCVNTTRLQEMSVPSSSIATNLSFAYDHLRLRKGANETSLVNDYLAPEVKKLITHDESSHAIHTRKKHDGGEPGRETRKHLRARNLALESFCNDVFLKFEDIDDITWKRSRLISNSSPVVGLISLCFLCLSSLWKAVHFKAISLSLIYAYLADVAAFFFLESELCLNHGCTLGKGGVYGIIACFFWLAAALSTIKISRDYEHETYLEKMLRKREQNRINKLGGDQ
mmetsp:Transcript_51567/g.62131  ORF Transcript_51567/g.62131 Transcript_51567/m.62131 type:complete len:374 (-) Transcript_51567:515-1636(-)